MLLLTLCDSLLADVLMLTQVSKCKLPVELAATVGTTEVGCEAANEVLHLPLVTADVPSLFEGLTF